MVRIITQELNPSTKFGGKLDPEKQYLQFSYALITLHPKLSGRLTHRQNLSQNTALHSCAFFGLFGLI